MAKLATSSKIILIFQGFIAHDTAEKVFRNSAIYDFADKNAVLLMARCEKPQKELDVLRLCCFVRETYLKKLSLLLAYL